MSGTGPYRRQASSLPFGSLGAEVSTASGQAVGLVPRAGQPAHPIQPPFPPLLSVCLAWARDRMEQAGVDSPWLTALVLLEHAAGLGREHVLAHPERALTARQLAEFQALVERRCRREPLAYILGYREFYGRRLRVSADVLIPRPETEGLVDLARDRMDRWTSAISDGAADPAFADVGTGSGAIAVTLLIDRPRWRGIATDRHLAALRLAVENAEQQGVADRLLPLACDLATAVRRRVPVVVANLPYVPTARLAGLEPEVARYEPLTALDGGADGTAIIEALLASLPDLLLEGGSALLEIGEDQSDVLGARARAAFPDASVRIEPDAAGFPRYLVIDRGV